MACPFMDPEVQREIMWEVAGELMVVLAPLSLPVVAWGLAVWWKHVFTPPRVVCSRDSDVLEEDGPHPRHSVTDFESTEAPEPGHSSFILSRQPHRTAVAPL